MQGNPLSRALMWGNTLPHASTQGSPLPRSLTLPRALPPPGCYAGQCCGAFALAPLPTHLGCAYKPPAAKETRGGSPPISPSIGLTA